MVPDLELANPQHLLVLSNVGGKLAHWQLELSDNHMWVKNVLLCNKQSQSS